MNSEKRLITSCRRRGMVHERFKCRNLTNDHRRNFPTSPGSMGTGVFPASLRSRGQTLLTQIRVVGLQTIGCISESRSYNSPLQSNNQY
jgi:hypothetical protein